MLSSTITPTHTINQPPPYKVQSTDLPFVTVIMPVRNEAAYIERSLGSVLTQDYPPDRLEILVVDGMSTDGTRERVLQSANHNPQSAIRLLDNPACIVPSALNIGLTCAQGDIFVRVDGHCQIPPDYVTRCVELLQSAKVDCAGGAIDTIGETPIAQTIAVAMSSSFGVGGSAFRTVRDRTLFVDTLAFGAYTRAAIERCGRFDEELVRNQDEEYNYRLRGLGGQLLLSSQIRSCYYSRGTLNGLWRQYFQYGLWKVRVLQKHPRQMQIRQFIPPIFVATLLGSAVLTLITCLDLPLLALVVGTYAVALLVASIWTASRRGWEHVSSLPLIYTILHVSYGLGFFVGLAKFWNRWGDRQEHMPVLPIHNMSAMQ